MNVLVIWASENEELSYRQGMNEIAAVIIYSIYPYYFFNFETKYEDRGCMQEYLKQPQKFKKEIYQCIFNEKTFECDVYIIFDGLMKNGLQRLYESKGNIDRENAMKFKQYDLFSFKVDNDDTSDTTELKKRCDVIIKSKLKDIDGDLYNHFIKIDLNCTIFMQKWIKCLFCREFEPEITILLWDIIISIGNDLELIDYITIAMIESIRDKIIYQAQDEAFQNVFHFSHNNKKNAIEIIADSLEFKDKFDKRKSTKSTNPLSFKINKEKEKQNVNKKNIYTSNFPSISSNSFNPTNLKQSQSEQQDNNNNNGNNNNNNRNEPSNKNTLKPILSSSKNQTVFQSNFGIGSAISSIGNFIKGYMASETNNTQPQINEQMMKYSAKEISNHVYYLENILAKVKEQLSQEEILQFEATIRFFKIGGIFA